jgi:hypothetical protein
MCCSKTLALRGGGEHPDLSSVPAIAKPHIASTSQLEFASAHHRLPPFQIELSLSARSGNPAVCDRDLVSKRCMYFSLMLTGCTSSRVCELGVRDARSSSPASVESLRSKFMVVHERKIDTQTLYVFCLYYLLYPHTRNTFPK